jgi:hypothetical protein
MYSSIAELRTAAEAKFRTEWYPGKPLSPEEKLIREIDSLIRSNQVLNKQVSDASWITNPDRMGGAFSQDEIDRSRNGGW